MTVTSDGEGPVPVSWRPTIASLVETVVRPDLRFGTGVPGVEPVSDEVLTQCRDAVEAYGEVTLVSLADETWESSVCQWAGDHWDCLVDLWTAEEGCSDLALELEVRERGSRFEFRLIMINVP